MGCVCNLAINILYLQYAALLGACSKSGILILLDCSQIAWRKNAEIVLLFKSLNSPVEFIMVIQIQFEI